MGIKISSSKLSSDTKMRIPKVELTTKIVKIDFETEL